MEFHLRPVRFVDSPASHPDATVARLAGGMQWFSAYEVISPGARRTVALADLDMLGERGRALHAAITAPRPPLAFGGETLRFDQPQVAAILNITPDSFSDGGAHGDDPASAAAVGIGMVAAGAALIDVGGESTRPGATIVGDAEEIRRVVPVVERLAGAGVLVSIDTRKAVVMEAALAAGARIVNDVSALLWDDHSAAVVASAQCPVILMHAADPGAGAGGGRGAYHSAATGDALAETLTWLERRIAAVVAAGIDRARIIVDPGIGFGKQLADDLALVNGLAAFHGLGCPIMLGASRKRLIGALANEAPVGERLAGSIALALKAADSGTQLLRVHDVAATVQAVRVWRGLRDRALTDEPPQPPAFSSRKSITRSATVPD